MQFAQQVQGGVHQAVDHVGQAAGTSRLTEDAAAGDLDKTATVLRFYYINSPPPLTVGLFFIHNHPDGTYSGKTAPF